ncbi:IBR domain-containing protein [Colletotrichum incanum]|nr:IBR domain-containing protein [Colletotrichum incanum]
MELFQRLDEDVSNLIISHGFLDMDNLRFATNEEVENAAALALEIVDPDMQLAIAMRQSTIVNRHSPNNDNNVDPHDPSPSGYITWEERNRLLAESRSNSVTTSEADDDNEDKGPECVVCTSGRQPKNRLPCGCWMCPRCLRACIRAGLRAGGWPPRCCEPLHQEHIEQAGRERPGLLRLYRQIREENETDGEERVYCSRPACAAFIPSRGPHVRGDDMECPACREGMCRRCRQTIHPGRPCREEDEDEMLMDAMDENNFSPCPRCRRIIDLAGGCHHITCPCGYEFCFQCGGPWRGRCTRGCGLYPQDGQGRVPVRERGERCRQGQDPDELLPILWPEGLLQPVPPPRPLPLPQQQQPQPQAELLHPQAAHGLWQPIPPELLQAVPVQEFRVMHQPNMEFMNREGRIRQGRGRYSIIMYYADGSNTEPETRHWRADRRAYRRRPEEGSRAWPVFEIHPEDPLCSHHVPTSWAVEDMNNRLEPPQLASTSSLAPVRLDHG